MWHGMFSYSRLTKLKVEDQVDLINLYNRDYGPRVVAETLDLSMDEYNRYCTELGLSYSYAEAQPEELVENVVKETSFWSAEDEDWAVLTERGESAGDIQIYYKDSFSSSPIESNLIYFDDLVSEVLLVCQNNNHWMDCFKLSESFKGPTVVRSGFSGELMYIVICSVKGKED